MNLGLNKKIVIFVSGSGSNMSNLIKNFKLQNNIEVSGVFSNKQSCLAIQNARKDKIRTITFTKNELDSELVLNKLIDISPDLIVLAGFLLKIPESIVNAFPNKIINVHPALLPNYGGKGMYGTNVHKAVIEAKEKKSGITFHYVNEHYDEGNIIAQFECDLSENETLEELQQKIHLLEYANFPNVIKNTLFK